MLLVRGGVGRGVVESAPLGFDVRVGGKEDGVFRTMNAPEYITCRMVVVRPCIMYMLQNNL